MKTSKMKKIMAGAIAMMALSTASAVTGTVAWFTASTKVAVSGMQMQADTESGIVISNEAKSEWKTSAVAQHTGANQAFIPTSTAEFSNWYHANSENADNHAAIVDSYALLSVSAPTPGTSGTGLGTTNDINSTTKNVYLLNEFYLQTSTASQLTGQDVKLCDLVVTADHGSLTGNDNIAKALALDKALRLGIECNGSKTIFGCFDGFTASYNVNNNTAVTAVSGTTVVGSEVTIPAFDSAGATSLTVKTYLWFEGEDAGCKSSNITAYLDTLSIKFNLDCVAHNA